MSRTVVLGLLAACGGGGGPTGMNGGGGGGGSAAVAQVRLFNDHGQEISAHVALIVGDTMRIRVGLYGPDGAEVTSIPAGVTAGLTFSPDTLARVFPVDNQPLMFDVTPTAVLSPGDPLPGGLLSVALYFPPDSVVVETYCCFEVLVHLVPP